MNDRLFESLLYEDESETLDFKRDQYPFAGATDDQKGELLKDILAFANAWRRTTAFILIGVSEARGAKSEVVGVDEHLLNRNLQQFVNSKTNRPVDFSYREYEFEGMQVGIISIPVQVRPSYAISDYGRVQAEQVYIRRGDMTATAKPDEVARMGSAVLDSGKIEPQLSLELCDNKERKRLGVKSSALSIIAKLPNSSEIPRYGTPPQTFQGVDLSGPSFENRDYYRDFARFIGQTNLLTPFGLYLRNTGTVRAEDVAVRIQVGKSLALSLHSQEDYPPNPSSSAIHFPDTVPIHREESEIFVHEHSDAWSLDVQFGTVQPGNDVWSSTQFYVGAREPQEVILNCKIVSNNLSLPILSALTIRVECASRVYSTDDVTTLANQFK